MVKLADDAERSRKAGPAPSALDKQDRNDLEKQERKNIRVLQETVEPQLLEIDPKTGALFYRNPDRVELRSREDVREMVKRDRRNLLPGQQLYYVVRLPHDPTSNKPERDQQEQYEDWLKDLAAVTFK
jgi:hypothetical protein